MCMHWHEAWPVSACVSVDLDYCIFVFASGAVVVDLDVPAVVKGRRKSAAVADFTDMAVADFMATIVGFMAEALTVVITLEVMHALVAIADELMHADDNTDPQAFDANLNCIHPRLPEVFTCFDFFDAHARFRVHFVVAMLHAVKAGSRC